MFFRRLLPVQLNTDEHDPEFCRDNFNDIAEVNVTLAEAMCPVSEDDFAGAPPTVIITPCGVYICI